MTYKLPEPENEGFSDGCTFDCPEGWSKEQMQAAYAAGQRDMLAGCIEAAQSRKMPAAQCVYNMGVDRVIDKLKELLNEQH